MPVTTQILTPGDEAWQRVLQAFAHDIYHLPEYAELAQTTDGGAAEAVLVTRGDAYFFLPYLVRSVPTDPSHQDITSPYGYPGPLLVADTPDFARLAVDAWLATLADRKIVSAFIRMHPLLGARPDDLHSHGSLPLHGACNAVGKKADRGHRSDGNDNGK